MTIQNKAGYTAVMLACLTAPDGPGGMEVVRKLMELGNIHLRSSQVIQPLQTRFKCHIAQVRSGSGFCAGCFPVSRVMNGSRQTIKHIIKGSLHWIYTCTFHPVKDVSYNVSLKEV